MNAIKDVFVLGELDVRTVMDGQADWFLSLRLIE